MLAEWDGVNGVGGGGGWFCGRKVWYGGQKARGRHIRVIGSEAQDDVSHRPHHESVPSHWHCGESFVSHVLASIFSGANSGLECVAVEMEGMSARVVVVEYDLYNVVVLQDVGVRIDAIDGGVVGKVAGGKSGVEGRDFRGDICYVVEECAMTASQLQYTYLEENKAY